METEGGSQLFETQKREGHKKWAVKRARVVQIYDRDHAEVQKKKEVLYSVKKKTWEKKESRVISCQHYKEQIRL